MPSPGVRVALVGCGSSRFVGEAVAAWREAGGNGESNAFAASEMPGRQRYEPVVVRPSVTSRQHVEAALNHREADRTPLDLGGTTVSGIQVRPLYALRQALRLDPPGTPIRLCEPFQMLGEVTPDLVDVLGIDTFGWACQVTFSGSAMMIGSPGPCGMARRCSFLVPFPPSQSPMAIFSYTPGATGPPARARECQGVGSIST